MESNIQNAQASVGWAPKVGGKHVVEITPTLTPRNNIQVFHEKPAWLNGKFDGVETFEPPKPSSERLHESWETPEVRTF
jgi:hypothetical protein